MEQSEWFEHRQRCRGATAALARSELTPEAVPVLTELLGEDTDPEIWRNVAMALGGLEAEAAEAIPELIAGLEKAQNTRRYNKAAGQARVAIVEALGRIGPHNERVRERLQTVSTDDLSPGIRRLAERILEKTDSAKRR
jgi:hypothetical protein